MTEPTLHQALQQALDHHRQGRLTAAESLYRAILDIHPTNPEASHGLGRLIMEADQPAAALPWLRRALEANPGADEHWLTYASALQAAGHAEAAQAILDLAQARGISAMPSAITPHERQALIDLLQTQRLDDAETLVRQLIEQHPRDAFPWKIHGSILAKRMRSQEALAPLRKASELDPLDPEIPNTRGVALMNLGRLAEAAESYRQALALAPAYVEAHYNLGHVCKRLGLWTETESSYRQTTLLDPDCAEAHGNLGNLYFQLWRLSEAEACYRKALTIQPKLAEAHGNLGSVLHALGRLSEAEASFREALALAPRSPKTHNNLGNMLRTLGRLSEAEASYRQALTLDPNLAETYSNLGNVLNSLGRVHEAEQSFRRALAIQPSSQSIYSNLLFTAAYSGTYSADWIQRESVNWEHACLSASEREEARRRRLTPLPRQGRPLRLGLISAELGQHAVAYFLLSWLRALDPERIELHLYPTKSRADRKAQEFLQLTDAWTPLTGLTDAEAAARIRADQVDVLIDTSGHTAGNRLGVLAHRAAPVQCHYIGYFATTGLTEMDWLLADATLIPPQLDTQFSERIWRLDRPWMAYAPLEDAPLPDWQPDPDGILWLGSFNSLTKVRDECLTLWAQVLLTLPEARLLLKDRMTRDPATRERILRVLAQSGVAAERVVFAESNATWREHMERYNRLDIALDPIPMTGGSTAFDALWMGIPLVTLAGDRLIGRQGAAALTGLGRSDWIAHSPQEYVAIVASLARNAETRRQIRLSQRERMRQSPLCDGNGMAHAIQDAIEQMFDLWWQEQHANDSHVPSHQSQQSTIN